MSKFSSKMNVEKFIDFLKTKKMDELIKSNHHICFNIVNNIIEYACDMRKSLPIFEDKIIETKNPYFIYRYVSMMLDSSIKVDIVKFQQAIIECNDAEWMYKFASRVPGTDIELIRTHLHTAGGIQHFIEAFDRDFPLVNVNND